MSKETHVLLGVACVLGIFLACQSSRSRQQSVARSTASDANPPDSRTGLKSSGRWLLQFERRTESRIVALWVEVRNPTDQPVCVAQGNRKELEPSPEVVQRRRAEGVQGPHALGVERQLKGTTEWEQLWGDWVPEKKQTGDDPTGFPAVARLDSGETRSFLLILGTILEREGDSMYRWRIGLFDAAGGRLDQVDLSP